MYNRLYHITQEQNPFSAPENRITAAITGCHFSLWNISDTPSGTEELAHLEMVSTIVHQLTRDLSMEEIEKSGFGPYYIDHTVGIWPQAAGGIPFNACEFQSKGDPITDLFENLAADGAYRKNNKAPDRTQMHSIRGLRPY